MKKYKISCKVTNSPNGYDFDDYVEAESPADAFKYALWGLADAITDFGMDVYGKDNLQDGEVYALDRDTDETVETYYNFKAVDIETEKTYYLGANNEISETEIF